MSKDPDTLAEEQANRFWWWFFGLILFFFFVRTWAHFNGHPLPSEAWRSVFAIMFIGGTSAVICWLIHTFIWAAYMAKVYEDE